MQEQVNKFIKSNIFQCSIISLIIINAILLGMETSDSIMSYAGGFIKTADTIILYIFIIEIFLRLYANRLKFFTQPWSIFDLVIVMISLAPASEAFSVLRALRILRVLRLLSTVDSMRKVIEGLLSAIPGMASVTFIMMLFFYIFAVVGTHLYSDTFPQWFGSIGETMYSLFQVMTLESWSMGIVRPVMEEHPNAWIYFITYILTTTFTTLNLFIAIIVNAMHSDESAQAEESREELREELIKQIKDSEKRILEKVNGG